MQPYSLSMGLQLNNIKIEANSLGLRELPFFWVKYNGKTESKPSIGHKFQAVPELLALSFSILVLGTCCFLIFFLSSFQYYLRLARREDFECFNSKTEHMFQVLDVYASHPNLIMTQSIPSQSITQYAFHAGSYQLWIKNEKVRVRLLRTKFCCLLLFISKRSQVHGTIFASQLFLEEP